MPHHIAVRTKSDNMRETVFETLQTKIIYIFNYLHYHFKLRKRSEVSNGDLLTPDCEFPVR